jgi:hypothetical protein
MLYRKKAVVGRIALLLRRVDGGRAFRSCRS